MKKHTHIGLIQAQMWTTYWTHSGHHGVDIFSVSTVVCEPLTEEKVQFGIVGVRPVWYQVGVDKNGLWDESKHAYFMIHTSK